MKALVIHQPYAQLVAEGVKSIETRIWPTPRTVLGTRIAICAGKSQEHMELLDDDTMARAIERVVDGTLDDFRGRLLFGHVIATAVVADCEQMTREFLDRWPEHTPAGARERAFGWFGFGRYAWHLTDVHRLQTPVPVRGGQRVFNLAAQPNALVEAQEAGIHG